MGRLYTINERIKHIKKRMRLAWDGTVAGYLNKNRPRTCSCRLCRFWNSMSKYRRKPKISDLRRMPVDEPTDNP